MRLLIEEQRGQRDRLDRIDQRMTVMESDMAEMKSDTAGMQAMLVEILSILKK